ncbi:MAG: hypothetical protein IBX49_04455, partial [Gammaproteobacteria bacterium]|nr:hypothetical protein [Gammaproteobacteria bacterium]
ARNAFSRTRLSDNNSLLKVDDRIKVGQTLIVIESMEMEMEIEIEIVISANADGEVRQILCSEGKQLSPGQNLLILAHQDDAS